MNHLTTTYIDQTIESDREDLILIPVNFQKLVENILDSIKDPLKTGVLKFN